MSQPMNFHVIEDVEMLGVTDENNTFGNNQAIIKKGYRMDEHAFHEVQKTVENLVGTLEVVNEDILEISMVTEDIFDTVTVIEDLLGTVRVVNEDFLHFAKTDENISDSPTGSENQTMECLEKTENRVLFQNNALEKFEKGDIFEKAPEHRIAKEVTHALLIDNASPSREAVRSSKELVSSLSSENSNKTSFNDIIEKMNISELVCHYIEYQKSRSNSLSTLHESSNVLEMYLEERSFIAKECRIAITDIDQNTDVNSMSEQELKDMNRALMEKVTVYKECLRSLCWNLDSIKNKIRPYKRLNETVDMKRNKLLNLIL